MSVVIVERVWERAYTADELLTIYRDTGWCFGAHGVRPLVHILAANGMRGCCLMEAPDAEAVRTARWSLGVRDPEHLWSATLHGPCRTVADLRRRAIDVGATAMLVLVECSFAAPAEPDVVDAAVAAELSRRGAAVLTRLVSRDRRRMLCLVAAPDVDSVVDWATGGAGLPVDRAWAASVHFDD